MPVIRDYPGYPDVVGPPVVECATSALVIVTARWQDGSEPGAPLDLRIRLSTGEVRVGQTDVHGVVTFDITQIDTPSVDFEVDGNDRNVCASHPLASSVAAQGTCHPLILLRRAELHLRLRVRDPEGRDRSFPAGVMLDAIYSDGHRERVSTEDGGVLHLDDAGRPEDALADISLAFVETGRNLVSEPRGEPVVDRWVEDRYIEGWVRDGYRVISVPNGLTTATGRWEATLAPNVYGAGVFHPLQAVGRMVGTPTAPVDLRLRPQWQYLRLTYYDRILAGDDQRSIPPRWLEGIARHDDGWEDRPVAASNWTVGEDPMTACQCLPWIDQQVAKPDNDVVLRFRTPEHTFIESDDDGGRRVVVKDPSTIAPRDRLRYYDLPTEWRSSHHFVRTAPRGSADGVGFDVVGDVIGSPEAPLIFSLDDIVLVGPILSPTDLEDEQRVTLFSHRFATGPGLDTYGIYRKHAGSEHKRYPFSRARTHDVGPFAAYISEYPDWTRLVVAKGGLFDVFDRRVTNQISRLYGQRAAVDWLGRLGRAEPRIARTPSCTMQSQFRQEYPDCKRALPPGAHDFTAARWTAGATKTIGISELALLRHCGRTDDVERAVVFQYVTLGFEFEEPFDDDEDVEDDFTVKESAYVRTAIDQSITRWSGPDGEYNPGRPRIIPQGPNPALEVDVMWFCQTDPDDHRYAIEVKPTRRRTHMTDAGTGDWSLEDHQADLDGSHAAAHELGHATSLPDEYAEGATKCSYERLPLCSNGIFADPYRHDQTGMMKGNRHVRARYYWHLAEWLDTLGLGDFRVEHAGRRYRLPHQPNNEVGALRTFVNWPLRAWSFNPVSGPSCDVYLYALGDDGYTRAIPSPRVPDGIVEIDVKIKVTTALDPQWNEGRGTYFKTRETLSLIEDMMASRSHGLGQRWIARGRVNAITLASCPVRFNLRFLVETFADEEVYPQYNRQQATPDQPPARDYGPKVADLEGRHPPHMQLRLGEYEPELHGGRISLPLAHANAVPRFVAMQLGLVPDLLHYPEDLSDLSWRAHVDLAPLLARVLDDPVVEAIQ